MQAFYYAMPVLAVIVVGMYIFTSIKLHKFLGSVGLWLTIGIDIFSVSKQGVLGLLVLEAILLEGIIEEYKYQKQNLSKNEE